MKKYLLLSLVFAITYFFWRGVLEQTLLGEGSIYFSHPYLELLDNNIFQTLLARHDTQALIFFRLTRDLIRDNFKFYMWFLIAGTAFVNLSIFYLIKHITKSSFAALATAIFAAANFVGSFEILGLGYYQWFIQRVPNFGLAFISLILFISFLENKKKYYYYLSFLIYTLAVFLARYSIHILPLFILCDFFFVFWETKKMNFRRKLILFLLTSAPLVIISFILFRAQSLVSGNSSLVVYKETISFSLLPTLNQLSYLTFPFLIPVTKYVPFTIFAYFISFAILFIKSKSTRYFVASLFLAIPISISLSILLNPIFIGYFDSSRYLYYTSLLVSAYWGIFLWVLLRVKKILIIPIIFLILVWAGYNKHKIDTNFAMWQERHNKTYATFNFFKESKAQGYSFPTGSRILIAKEVGHYGAAMINYLYGKESWTILLDDEPQVKYDFYLRYDELKGIEKIDNNAIKN